MADRAYRRPQLKTLLTRIREPRRFIQVIAGPRQAGKTTLARQAIDASGLSATYASADEPSLRDRTWLEAQWDAARLQARDAGRRGALLVLDEAQKVPDWSETIKRLWDEDSAAQVPLRVILLGSAPLLVQRGLTESLAGRFEMIRLTHWSYPEMNEAFGFDLERYVFFGGYPGAAPLVRDHERWARYILDSLVETTLSRDILLLTRVDKPALLRQLFRLGCDYSGQVLSYQKMLGQLQEAGNTTTLAHYLELLAGAGMLTGLQKFSGSRVRQRGSSPKLLALNTALVSATSGVSARHARRDPDLWGRLTETAVGAHLVNTAQGTEVEVFYWRERNREVDFVLRRGRRLTAIEVTSGRRKGSFPGLAAFTAAFAPTRVLLVGGQGVPLSEFLGLPAAGWLR
jgi:predicted AAA+ superfamily ATPase